MCKLSKEIDSFQQLTEEDQLGRRSAPEQAPAGEPASSTFSRVDQSQKDEPPAPSSLTSEIQNLILLNRNKALNPQNMIPDDKSTSESSGTDYLSVNHLSTKRLICQESSQKFGLINRKNFGKSVFHLVKEFDEEAEGTQTTMADISHKIDSVLTSQNYLIQNLLSQCHKSTMQMEDLKLQVKDLSTKLNERWMPVAGSSKEGFAQPEKFDVLNKFTLLSYLSPKTTFGYSLELSTPLEATFVKERNFKADFKIVDKKTGKVLNSSAPIFLEMKIYSSENPPKQIELNTCGNSIFKGNTLKEAASGLCSFEKIQIKEVSSHFRNGWVFIVVQAKAMCETSTSLAEDIQPFILDNVVVKAKLNTRKKEDCCEDDCTGLTNI